EAYFADITYGTNNEFGFDYLRDNMVFDLKDQVQRGFHFAIVDEVDSILIDESRTPLIISQPDFEATKRYSEFARYISGFQENEDYNVDYKMKAVSLTEKGIDKITKLLGRDPYKEGDVQILHHITQALRAKALYKRDRDYVVRDGEVIIVDEFTGRLLHGRRFSEGLHQAVEAQENVEVKAESRTLATITFQNYFRLYQKLAGMTGTAETSSEEFFKVYNLEVVVIPTNKPMIRRDKPDKIYKTEKAKYEAIVKEIVERYKKGQPVLVGTRSIDKNEELSKYLRKADIPHNVLNAKNHEKEGEIIAQAGRFKSVTVATNMAGRGVDIILGGNPPDPENRERVIRAGGLFVLGTERHEARRIDNQLRGRSGRQGDPGESQFIVSLEDEILRVLGGERLKQVMERFHMPDNEPIQHPFISSLIEKAQSKIEALNFDLRKHVLEYDDVLNVQRQTIYRLRRQILEGHEAYKKNKKTFILKDTFLEYVKRYLNNLVGALLPVINVQAWDVEELSEEIKNILKLDFDLHKELEGLVKTNLRPELKQKEIIDYLYAIFVQEFERREKQYGQDLINEVLRYFILHNIDFYWQEHLTVLQDLREAVRLRAYGQRDPLVEYKTEARRHFSILLNYIESQVVQVFYKVEMVERKQEQRPSDLILVKEDANVLPTSEASNAIKLNNEGFKTKSNVYYQYHERKPQFGRKIGRNEPCPCGAKKPNGQPVKYKHCHGKNI
ncbi:MAG: preprotein translocase subunit SecA, partial [Candidatus Bathyarchaeia archaeon]